MYVGSHFGPVMLGPNPESAGKRAQALPSAFFASLFAPSPHRQNDDEPRENRYQNTGHFTQHSQFVGQDMSDYSTIFVGNGKNANGVSASMDAIHFADPAGLEITSQVRELL